MIEEKNFLTLENLKFIYDNVESTIAKSLTEVPKELRQKRQEHEKLRAELQNLRDYHTQYADPSILATGIRAHNSASRQKVKISR